MSDYNDGGSVDAGESGVTGSENLGLSDLANGDIYYKLLLPSAYGELAENYGDNPFSKEDLGNIIKGVIKKHGMTGKVSVEMITTELYNTDKISGEDKKITVKYD